MKLAKFSAKLVANFRRSLADYFRASFAGENRQKHFPPKLPPQISPSNFTTRFWVVAGPRYSGGITLFFLSLFFWKRARKTTKKTRIFKTCRTPKIPGKEGKNARKNKEFLASEKKKKNKEFQKSKERKDRVIMDDSLQFWSCLKSLMLQLQH